jgi:hypothetical protein
MKSSTETLIKAMYILSNDIQSEDGIANAAILEAATRLEELYKENNKLKDLLHKAGNYLDNNLMARRDSSIENEIKEATKRTQLYI